MSEFSITTTVSIISLLIAAVPATIAILSMMKSNKELEDKDLEKSVKNEMRMDRFGSILESIQEATDKLLDGFSSNEKRITLLEYSVEELTKKVDELEGHHGR